MLLPDPIDDRHASKAPGQPRAATEPPPAVSAPLRPTPAGSPTAGQPGEPATRQPGRQATRRAAERAPRHASDSDGGQADERRVGGQTSEPQGAQASQPHSGGIAGHVDEPEVPESRSAALLETSTFWLSDEERARQAAAAEPERPSQIGVPPRHRIREPRRPQSGLPALVALALVAAFFAWVSAEPFWLAVGHDVNGQATVTRCTGDGISQRCFGQFATGDGFSRVDRVTVLGLTGDQRAPGASSPARMVNLGGRQAYVGETGLLMQLRWTLGFVLVLLSGLGIAGLTGARRLENPRARYGALLLSIACPLGLLAGFLAAAY
ncbi:hypothetical protein [Krasilnikovia sp. M28-CT-15]|uniref:hypothetical protein n=1 Tax=Krasilnikovia sp. M28-CT-15 TaxID=3373540 RepID=UPI00399CB408